jgi:hypothetical protein
MGLKGIVAKPQRNDYLIPDPDIRGLRLRYGRWSSTFTAGSFTYTRASAMKVGEDMKGYSALHMARPVVRVAPLEKASRCEADYTTLGREGTTFTYAQSARCAVVATSYAPVLTSDTWQKEQPVASWRMNELWLMTDLGMVGLLDSTATADSQARELCHQFRFIIPNHADAVQATDNPSLYACGGLRFRVWSTDFGFAIRERVRLYAYGQHDRDNWQLALSDRDRSPENVAQDPPPAGQPKPTLRLPEMRNYPQGYHRYSLAEISPTTVKGFESVEVESRDGVLAFRAQMTGETYLAVYNPTEAECSYRITSPSAPKSVSVSWDSNLTPEAGLTLRIPPRGTALVRW